MHRALVVILFPIHSFAFLEFIGGEAKKASEAIAYADTVGELMTEVSNDTEIRDGANTMRKRSETLRSEVREIQGISTSTRMVLSGPDWSTKRLETNIKSTTDYIRRVKRLLARVMALGTAGATAVNTAETNMALNEVQKNQQAMILQLEDQRLREMEKESADAKTWDQFSSKQRNIRFSKAQSSGKL